MKSISFISYQEQSGIDEGVNERDVQRHFVRRRRRLRLVVAVAEQRHEEQRAPKDEVGHRDDDEHFDTGQTLLGPVL